MKLAFSLLLFFDFVVALMRRQLSGIISAWTPQRAGNNRFIREDKQYRSRISEQLSCFTWISLNACRLSQSDSHPLTFFTCLSGATSWSRDHCRPHLKNNTQCLPRSNENHSKQTEFFTGKLQAQAPTHSHAHASFYFEEFPAKVEVRVPTNQNLEPFQQKFSLWSDNAISNPREVRWYTKSGIRIFQERSDNSDKYFTEKQFVWPSL